MREASIERAFCACLASCFLDEVSIVDLMQLSHPRRGIDSLFRKFDSPRKLVLFSENWFLVSFLAIVSSSRGVHYR